jgi:hypothetical protein
MEEETYFCLKKKKLVCIFLLFIPYFVGEEKDPPSDVRGILLLFVVVVF